MILIQELTVYKLYEIVNHALYELSTEQSFEAIMKSFIECRDNFPESKFTVHKSTTQVSQIL